LYFALVLHAHLPYVRHPEHDRSLEERWFYEAMWECYLPLIDLLGSAPHESGVPLATVSLSPTLLEMAGDPLLLRRFERYLDEREELAEHVLADKAFRSHRPAIAHALGGIRAARSTWERIGKRFARAFVELKDASRIELITTAATHAFLPVMKTSAAVRAQIRLGLRAFEAHTKSRPRGFWLPECGINAPLLGDVALARIGYTVADTHAIARATPPPPFGPFAPIASPSMVAVFGREPSFAERVWSRERGYPGNAAYRDFYRDVGFDASDALLGNELASDGKRGFSGIKHCAIGDREKPEKPPYDPSAARAKVIEHADDFVIALAERLALAREQMPHAPIVVSPYDAELFGHWWHEGPMFLREVFARLPARGVTPIALGAYLAREPNLALSEPAASSWGAGGHGDVWLHPRAAPLLRYVHHGEINVLRADAAVRDALSTGQRRRARIQAIRELFCLSASDWPFMVATGEGADYALYRVKLHKSRLDRLADLALRETWSPDDEAFLAATEAHNPIFARLDDDAYADAFDAW
jgi:1,4-alpha-glucan branching enzyme